MSKIDIDQLAHVILSEVENYKNATIQEVERAVKETAKEAVKELKEKSPVGASGEYAESWSYKRDKTVKKSTRYNMVVYSRKPNYRITHLLEKGHAKRGGGRVSARIHIKPVEQHAIKMLEERILKKI